MFTEDKHMNVFYPTDFLQGKYTYENLAAQTDTNHRSCLLQYVNVNNSG